MDVRFLLTVQWTSPPSWTSPSPAATDRGNKPPLLLPGRRKLGIFPKGSADFLKIKEELPGNTTCRWDLKVGRDQNRGQSQPRPCCRRLLPAPRAGPVPAAHPLSWTAGAARAPLWLPQGARLPRTCGRASSPGPVPYWGGPHGLGVGPATLSGWPGALAVGMVGTQAHSGAVRQGSQGEGHRGNTGWVRVTGRMCGGPASAMYFHPMPAQPHQCSDPLPKPPQDATPVHTGDLPAVFSSRTQIRNCLAEERQEITVNKIYVTMETIKNSLHTLPSSFWVMYS